MNDLCYNVHIMNTRQKEESKKEESITLEILETIDSQDNLTQRHLAANLGGALGLAHQQAICGEHKGLVKFQH